MPDILVLSRSAVGQRMASPGIRAYQLAGAVARALPAASLTLAYPVNDDNAPIDPPTPNVRMRTWSNNSEAVALGREHEVIVSRNFPPLFARLMGHHRLALDAFTPFYIEWMELSRRDIQPHWRRTWMSGNRWYLNAQLSLADYIFSADERQRDLWIGELMALALIPPDMYERDPSLRRFIDVVPYGVFAKPLEPTKSVLRGVVEGIHAGDDIILWNGGITEWNDPATLLHAMAALAERRPTLKLVFLGVNHPDMVFGPTAGVTRDAMTLSRELGLEGRTVFFLPGWTPYAELDNYLAEATLSVCLGYENMESRFAFRTRYVDVFRAAIPLVCTRGDVLAERVADAPMGIAVPERDVEAVAAGIERILDDEAFASQCRENARAIAAELAWDEVVKPLVAFIESGESYAMPPARRRAQTYTRAAMYLAMKKICRSQPLDFRR